MFSIECNLRFLRTALPAMALLASSQAWAETPLTREPLISWQHSTQQANPAERPQDLREDGAFRVAGFNVAKSKKETDGLAAVQQKPADPRQLAPQSQIAGSPDAQGFATNGRDALPFSIPQIESLTTAGAGLAIVVGLFLVCMWLLRRSGPKPTTPLPKEAVAVLGRVPLAARHFAHLLQVGNKLVLVAVTSDGVAPITEVTDPREVDRVLGLCMRNHKQSTTAEFQHVLQKLASEPAQGFLDNEAPAMSAGVRR